MLQLTWRTWLQEPSSERHPELVSGSPRITRNIVGSWNKFRMTLWILFKVNWKLAAVLCITLAVTQQYCHVTAIVTFRLWALAIPKGRSLRSLRDCIFCLQCMRVKTYSHVNSFSFVPNLLWQAEIGILPFGIDMAQSPHATLAVIRQYCRITANVAWG